MALHDHFHPPLSTHRHWHAFHNAWATYISSDLNRRLPEGYFAEPNVQFGIEIDVGTFKEESSSAPSRSTEDENKLIRETGEWTVPAPTQSLPFSVVTDVVEVLVFNHEAGPTLAAAVELVSPANKDRPAHRDAFVSKCAAYLQQGIGVIVLDIVTERKANLHDTLLERIVSIDALSWNVELYAAAYRPVIHNEQTSLDIWREKLLVGAPLPTLPLWLRGGISVPVDLEATYDRTCREQRIV